ncbi:gamma-glutamyltransferase [Phytohabitans suffuscus]|uniref:gamma-glutamyltransferase n=1 Tax=Phytohabitans suffuscus TaxID=624315 RepID=UPI001E3BB9C0|nr:gamma-glutamyltransferase [Phytohabitans suffuscus]
MTIGVPTATQVATPLREGAMRVPAGVAAGHPATAEVGLRILAAGGSAADAAVAAVLATTTSESILTGIGAAASPPTTTRRHRP